MTVDFIQAYRDGCRDAPATFQAVTEVEQTIARFCADLERATVNPSQVMMVGRVAMGGFGGHMHEEVEPLASSNPPHRDGGGWTRLVMCRVGGRASPSNGVELVAYRRADSGYPVEIRWIDGQMQTCINGSALEAALGNMLRDPHCNARIRKAVADFTSARTQ